MKNALFTAIEEKFDDVIVSYQGISGGDINQAIELILKKTGKVFIKYNLKASTDLFEKEAVGLAMLKHHATELYVPIVHDYGVLDGGLSYLVLEFIEKKPFQNQDFELLGRGLAHVHKVVFSHFGLDHDNYIGTLKQINSYKTDFATFFWECRIEPQLKLAVDSGLLDFADYEIAEQSSKNWESIFPDEAPSLLHGDLWSGNILKSEDGEICLIDPAIYYGHREMELAFTDLFGGFPFSFLEAYKSVFPLQNGFNYRKQLYQLYPILVHLNLFGSAYLQKAKNILKSYH